MSLTDLTPSRRALVAQAGMISAALTASAVPALAYPPSLSAVEEAYIAFIRLAGVADAAYETLWDIEAIFEEPDPLPFHHFQDCGHHYIVFNNPERTRGRPYMKTDDENVAYLKASIAAPFDPSRFEPEVVEWNRHCHAQRVEDMKKSLAKVVEWREERQRRADEAGLTEAQAAADVAKQALSAQIAKLLAMPSTNVRDLALKAHVVKGWRAADEAYDLLDDVVSLAGIPRREDVLPDTV